MGIKFDKWTLLKIFEVVFVLSCLIAKRVTDDEASRLFIYLQKLSREWSLLNNITWDRIGAAVADATYGGYLIITGALFFGKLFGELPTQKRITEMILLSVGALLFIVLGSLEFASLDSVPPDLIDNAAVLGTLSLITAALFLLDLAGPRQRTTKTQKVLTKEHIKVQHGPSTKQNGSTSDMNGVQNKLNMSKDNDDLDMQEKSLHEIESQTLPVSEKMEEHSPVWSKIQKGQYGKYDIVTPQFVYPSQKAVERKTRSPSSPSDPGFVQYTAKRWGQEIRHLKSPNTGTTQV